MPWIRPQKRMTGEEVMAAFAAERARLERQSNMAIYGTPYSPFHGEPKRVAIGDPPIGLLAMLDGY